MKKELQIMPLMKSFGIEIIGLDLSKPIDKRVLELLLCCYQQYQLLVIRKQVIDEAAFVRVGKIFGRLAVSRAPIKSKAFPQISLISNIKNAGVIVPEYWHSDAHYALKAYRGIIWHCLIAPKKGGETLFTNLRLAYEELPADLKKFIKHKHIFYQNVEDLRRTVVHPIVTYNAKAHAKALYVMTSGAKRVEGMKKEKSKRFIKKLEDHATNPAYIYSHRWQKGDIVICDNLSLLHSATSVPKTPRLLHRLHFY